VAYTRNQPIAGDALGTSVTYLANNTNAADDYFGEDHYAFSASSNNGLHKTVTTPAYVVTPPSTIGHPTTTTYPKIYGMQDTSNIGLIQYSRGINDAVPTPLTTIQSSASPITLGAGASLNILDFTGIQTAYANFYTFDALQFNPFYNAIFFVNFSSSGTKQAIRVTQSGSFSLNFSGSILTLTNIGSSSSNNLYWTLQFLRIQT